MIPIKIPIKKVKLEKLKKVHMEKKKQWITKESFNKEEHWVT